MYVEVKYMVFLLHLTFVQELREFYFFYFSASLREGSEGVKPRGGGRLDPTCAQTSLGDFGQIPQYLWEMGSATRLMW